MTDPSNLIQRHAIVDAGPQRLVDANDMGQRRLLVVFGPILFGVGTTGLGVVLGAQTASNEEVIKALAAHCITDGKCDSLTTAAPLSVGLVVVWTAFALLGAACCFFAAAPVGGWAPQLRKRRDRDNVSGK